MTAKTTKVKTMANLEACDCRWPFGDPRHDDFHFCGAKQVAGMPYCEEHAKMSFVPSKPRLPSGFSSASPFPMIRKAA